MTDLRDMLERLLGHGNLTEAEAGELLVALTETAVAPAMGGALLAALRSKARIARNQLVRAPARAVIPPIISPSNVVVNRRWSRVPSMATP